MTVLRIEGPLGKRLAAAVKKPNPIAALKKLLGASPPWLVFSGDGALDIVVHLEAPAFYAKGADEDEFFEDHDDKRVYTSRHKVKNPIAYDVGGFLLADITWIDKQPKDLGKLFELAADAYTGEMDAFDVESKDAPAPTGTSSGAFLGNAARTGNYAATVSRNKPKLVWTSKQIHNGGSEWGGSPVLAGGIVYASAAGYNATMSATRANGKALWDHELTKGQSWAMGSACVDRSVVYQATNQGLYSFDAKTGKQRWMARMSKPQGTPIVVGDLVFIAMKDGLVGLDLANGRKKWKFAVKDASSGVAFADGVFYLIANGKLVAVDHAKAKQLWSTPVMAMSAVPNVDADNVYVLGKDGFSAIDRNTGKPRWHAKKKTFDYNSTLAIADDRVVTRCEGKLVAYAKKTGKVLWTFANHRPDDIGSASPVIAGDVVLGMLVAEPSSTTSFHAVDLATGKQLWAFEADDFSWHCTPAVAEDGTIYVQASNCIKAFR